MGIKLPDLSYWYETPADKVAAGTAVASAAYLLLPLAKSYMLTTLASASLIGSVGYYILKSFNL